MTPSRIAAAALALAVAVLAAPVPRAAAAEEDGWTLLKNDSETVEVLVPPGYKEQEIKNPARVIHILYTGDPYLSTQVKVYAHQGQTDLAHYVKFVSKDLGVGVGPPQFLDGSPSKFTCDRAGGDGTPFISYCDAKIDGKFGYYVEILTPKSVFDEKRADMDRIMSSFATHPPPQDRFTVPAGWKKVENDLFAVIGPVSEVKDPAAQKAFENRLYRVSTWLDAQAPHVRMLRDFTGDRRRIVSRMVVHVLPTPEAFQSAAGDFWVEGAKSIYLPHHPERPVVVDGSPEVNLTEALLMEGVIPQYLETRMPPLRPWVRAGAQGYFLAAMARNFMPGLYPPEPFRKVKKIFLKPPALEDLMGRDEASLLSLGEEGALACWGYLQYGLHGQDAPVRNMFNRFFRGLVGAGDCQGHWDRCVEEYQAVNKKKLKLKDLETAAKKYWKDLKE